MGMGMGMGIGRSLSLLQCSVSLPDVSAAAVNAGVEISPPAAAFYSGRKGVEMND